MSVYAVIASGGKQYKVFPDDVLRVEKLTHAVGDKMSFDKVLMVSGDTGATGTPVLDKAAVTATVIAHEKSDKVVVFKKKRRKNYRRNLSHRQDMTVVKIGRIEWAGKKFSAPKAPSIAKTPAADKNVAVDPSAKASSKTPSKASSPKVKGAVKGAAKGSVAKKATGKKAPSKPTAPKMSKGKMAEDK